MVRRTDLSSKVARLRLSPYDRNTPKKSPQARATAITLPSSTSPSSLQPPPPISAQPGTLRASYLVICNRFYPNIHPRHDWDILVLGCRLFKDGDGDFYAFSDSYLDRDHSRFTAEQVSDGSAQAQLMREATEHLDMRDTPTGMKPCPGDDDVHIRPIPQSDYSLRIWGKGLELKRQYCLDFIHTATGEPANSPFEYELWAVPDKSTPWLPAGRSRIYSLERNFGISQEGILSEQEKFVLLEGTTCLLVRPGMRLVRFKVPTRSHPDHDITDVDDVEFS